MKVLTLFNQVTEFKSTIKPSACCERFLIGITWIIVDKESIKLYIEV